MHQFGFNAIRAHSILDCGICLAGRAIYLNCMTCIDMSLMHPDHREALAKLDGVWAFACRDHLDLCMWNALECCVIFECNDKIGRERVH